MNIDDRLEALTQSLELLASMHPDSENVERQSKNVDRLSLATERNVQGNARLEDLAAEACPGDFRMLAQP